MNKQRRNPSGSASLGGKMTREKTEVVVKIPVSFAQSSSWYFVEFYIIYSATVIKGGEGTQDIFNLKSFVNSFWIW